MVTKDDYFITKKELAVKAGLSSTSYTNDFAKKSEILSEPFKSRITLDAATTSYSNYRFVETKYVKANTGPYTVNFTVGLNPLLYDELSACSHVKLYIARYDPSDPNYYSNIFMDLIPSYTTGSEASIYLMDASTVSVQYNSNSSIYINGVRTTLTSVSPISIPNVFARIDFFRNAATLLGYCTLWCSVSSQNKICYIMGDGRINRIAYTSSTDKFPRRIELVNGVMKEKLYDGSYSPYNPLSYYTS